MCEQVRSLKKVINFFWLHNDIVGSGALHSVGHRTKAPSMKNIMKHHLAKMYD
jgi:hypothetical protein